MSKIHCYAINLARDTHRLENIKKQFEGKEDVANLHIVEAIDGQTDTKVQDIYSNKQDEILKNNICMMSRGEIACFLSHQKALKCFLDSDQAVGIILEDDAIIHNKLWNSLQDIVEYCAQHDVLCNLSPLHRKKYFMVNKHLNLIQTFRNRNGAVCYIINRCVAQIMIENKPVQLNDFMTKSLVYHNIQHIALFDNTISLLPTDSTIDTCDNEVNCRNNMRKMTINNVGYIQLKINRIRIQTPYQTAMLLFNIKQFGILRTIKVWLGIGH